MRSFVRFLALAAVLAACGGQSAADTVARTVRLRLAAEARRGVSLAGGEPGAAPRGEVPDAATLLAGLQQEGSWSDIPYESRDRSLWRPSQHLHRMYVLARAADAGGADAAKARDALRRSLEYWVLRDPQCDNWWWNTIGSQQALGPVLALARDDLRANAPELWEGGCRQLARSHTDGMTGTNLVWEAGNLFVLAALQDDDAGLARERNLIESEIVVTNGEGVQPDLSFHQHGPQLNAGNYGLSFVPSAARYALLVQGTPLAFAPSRLAILSGFQREFQEWVIWGSRLDLSACGRQLDLPQDQHVKALAIAQAGLLLGALDRTQGPHWQGLLDRVESRRSAAEGAPVGTRHYWRSDYLVYRPGPWYFSVKMFSSRVLRTETKINRENLRGYHLSDGMTQLLVVGDEYDDIQPVWDWRRLPGITFKEIQAPLPYGSSDGAEHNPRDFVGGVQAGNVGVAAMEIQKEDVGASKAWFCFPGGVVCLGSDIRSSGPQPVYTVIEQSLLHASVVGAGDRALLVNGIAYVLLGAQRWQFTAAAQSGSWSLLRQEGAPSAPVTRDVFKLWINHGVHPTGGTYAYALLPGATARRAASFALRPAYRVLANGAAQIVASPADRVVAAVFHRGGIAPAAAGLRAFAVDRPCIVVARRVGTAEEGVRYLVCDPTQKLHTLTLTPAGARPLTIRLPEGGQAGATVAAGADEPAPPQT